MKLPSSAELSRADLSHSENFTILAANGQVAGPVRPIDATDVMQRKIFQTLDNCQNNYS